MNAKSRGAMLMKDVISGEAAAPARISRAYYLPILLLLAAYVLNFLDRQVVAILAEPIKRDLHLADWQLGAMTGLSFAILYTFLGIPIAKLAERGDRPMIIGGAIGVWSFFTLVCGFAQTFTQLALARIGVGVGEAGCTPPALSLISEYVPRERRSTAMSIYLAGAPLGGVLGMALGGLVADQWGWRAAFLVAGAPGLVLALLTFFTLPEPRRKQKVAIVQSPTVREVVRKLLPKRTYFLVVGGVTLKAILQYGFQAFFGSFFFRNHAGELAAYASLWGLKSAGFLGVALGLTLGTSGILGSLAGGWLSDRFSSGQPKAQAWVPAFGAFASTPFYVAAVLVPSMPLALALLFIPSMLTAFYFGPAYAIVQGLVPPGMRAMATAIMLFVISLVGLGFGPLAVGITSDIISGPLGFGEAAGVRWSLALFALLGIPAGLLFLASAKTLQRDLES
ncbi:MAG: transporter [Alphaproteobacteria bacterium]|nr:transporter [Alphaproteobacteria bacterium]MDB5721867.1 transporter [Alphaproteobacteria bacterium]